MGLEEKVSALLDENKIWAEVWEDGSNVVFFQINWGDWKHDHLRAKWLCEQHGGVERYSYVTEENGSDCYSAVHKVAFFDGFKDAPEGEDE